MEVQKRMAEPTLPTQKNTKNVTTSTLKYESIASLWKSNTGNLWSLPMNSEILFTHALSGSGSPFSILPVCEGFRENIYENIREQNY